jgi:putative heme-binding domain-containing protein
LQLACTLGEWGDARAGKALGQLAVGSYKDKFILSAVMSSAVRHCGAIIDAAVSAGGPALATLSEPLLNLSLALDERSSVARLLEPCLISTTSGFTTEQMESFGRFLDTLSRSKLTLASLRDAHKQDALSKRLEAVPELFAAASAVLTNSTKSDSERVGAASLLVRESSTKPFAVRTLSVWLTPKASIQVKRSAIKVLAMSVDDSVPARLTANWSAFEPETRLAILDELMGREPWAFSLLQQVENGTVSRSSLDAVHRDRLLRHGSPRVKELAAKVLSAGNPTSRAKVIEDFRPALALTGDAKRGAALHMRVCAVCHKLGDVGNDIGPNLLSVTSHEPEKLLVSILDPNASIEPGFLAYTCMLANGEEYYGIISAETGNSIILKTADGKTHTILRNDIASLRSANLSLMPEGLESGMSKQDLADVIAFLRSPVGK